MTNGNNKVNISLSVEDLEILIDTLDQAGFSDETAQRISLISRLESVLVEETE